MTQGIFRKLFPGKFHEYLPLKKYFFPKTGHDSEAFPITMISNEIWNFVNSGNDPGEFPETFFQILEKVSGKASESWPVFGKKYFFMGKYSWNLPGNSFRKIPWVTPQNCKIWKKSRKSFRDIPWVTARFLEIVSVICLYRLKHFWGRALFLAIGYDLRRMILSDILKVENFSRLEN